MGELFEKYRAMSDKEQMTVSKKLKPVAEKDLKELEKLLLISKTSNPTTAPSPRGAKRNR